MQVFLNANYWKNDDLHFESLWTKSTQTAENTIKKRIEEVPTMKHLRCKDFIRLKMFCSECGLCQKINNNNSEKMCIGGSEWASRT